MIRIFCNGLDGLPKLKLDTHGLPDILHRAGQLMHAAFDPPHTRRLGLPNQRKQRGAKIRVAANIGGITRKNLCQTGIAEPLKNRLRQSLVRGHCAQQMG